VVKRKDKNRSPNKHCNSKRLKTATVRAQEGLMISMKQLWRGDAGVVDDPVYAYYRILEDLECGNIEQWMYSEVDTL